MNVEKAIKILRDTGVGTKLDYRYSAETLNAVKKLAIQALQAQAERRWIPVSEKLPENQQRVIVKCEKCPMVMGWLMFGEWHTDFGRMYKDYEVTHWMPLPERKEE